MFRKATRIARLLSRMTTPSSERHTLSRPNTVFRPRLELLEVREVPAAIVWRNYTGDHNFDNPANWMDDATLLPIGRIPTSGDDLYFRRGLGSTADCGNFHGAASTYSSLNIINDYTGTITLSSGFTTGTLIMETGAISQPSAGTDITVTSNFTWYGGELNTSGNIANLNLNGATAVFGPPDQTLYLGSNINFTNGAVGTWKEGNTEITNDGLEINIYAGSELNVDSGAGIAMFTGLFSQHIQVKPNASLTVQSGTLNARGRLTNEGTVTLKADTSAVFPGIATENVAYLQTSGATTLYGGANLFVGLGNKDMKITGGMLSTVVVDLENGYEQGVIIYVHTLEITGGDIYINNYSGVAHTVFGVLAIIGRVDWSGGTYHPFVEGTVNGGGDPDYSDLWYATKFTIGGTAAIEPTSIAITDPSTAIPVAPTSGYSWEILLSIDGITASPNFNAIVWDTELVADATILNLKAK